MDEPSMKRLMCLAITVLVAGVLYSGCIDEAAAQCSGIFTAGNVCGSPGGGTPGQNPLSSFGVTPCSTLGAFPVGTGSGSQCSPTAGSQANLTGIMQINLFSGNSADWASAGNVLVAAGHYVGAPVGLVGIQGFADYEPNADAAALNIGVYGVAWAASPHAFNSGDPLGGVIGTKGNAYAQAQVTATIQTAGSNNAVGDVLTVQGGTCNTNLNSPPQFIVTTIGGGGTVTGVNLNMGTGACNPYPSNPVTTTSSNVGATPPTLNLTVASQPTVLGLIGVSGRARNQSAGTVTDAIAIAADGAWNSAAGGVVTNAIGVWIQPPYSTVTNSYGIWFNGTFATSSIAAASGANITFSTSGGGAFFFNNTVQTTSTNAYIASSGVANVSTNYALGRTATDGQWGVAGNTNDFVTGAAAGDIIIKGQTNVWIASNGSGTTKAAFKADLSGLVTLPQYGTGIIHSSSVGLLSSSLIVSADLNITTTSCTNQFITAISATGVGACTTDTLASAQHANQGTTTTVLHGNAAGNPSWAAVANADLTNSSITVAIGSNVGISTSGCGPVSLGGTCTLGATTDNWRAAKFSGNTTVTTGVVNVNGIFSILDGGTQTFFAGMITELNGEILEFGTNEGTGNRFGGSNTAVAGGMFRFDARDTSGNPAFQVFTRAAGTSNNAGTLGLSIYGNNGSTAGGVVIGSGATDLGPNNLYITGTMTIAGLTTDATHTDRTVCQDTTSKGLFFGSGAAGICLGTSGIQFKNLVGMVPPTLDRLSRLPMREYYYKSGYGDDGAHLQRGPTAQDVAVVFPDLVRYRNGEAINYDWGALIFIQLRAIQELKVDNDNLHAEMAQLRKAIGR